jgi:two-component SAPR family response regulator
MNWLTGHRVLVVGDDFLIVTELVDEILEAGANEIISAADFPTALAAIDKSNITIAVIDINLTGKRDFSLAEKLAESEIPFVFLSGYSNEPIPLRFSKTPHLSKPYSITFLLSKLEEALYNRSLRTNEVEKGRS